MDAKIKLRGIYDERTLALAQDVGVELLAFDLRPLSLSFIQTHILQHLLGQISIQAGPLRDDSVSVAENPGIQQVSFQFGKDKDFVVANFLDLAAQAWGASKLSAYLHLEFAQALPEGKSGIGPYLEKYQINYSWWASELNDPQQLAPRPGQSGLIIPYPLLEELFQRQGSAGLEKLAQQLERNFSGRPHLELACAWESSPLALVMDILRPDVLSVAVSSSVELNYRNVDQMKLHRYLQLFCAQWGSQAARISGRSHALQ